jgi:uncharacterized protein (TIGR00251 family)
MKIVTVKIKPGASETKILSQNENKLEVAVAAPPEQNKANIELLKFLTKHFKSKSKLLEVSTLGEKLLR